MFKILTLASGVDASLQSIQDDYEIDAVSFLGEDSNFTKYLLVQYDTKPTGNNVPPASGSFETKQPAAKAAAAKPVASKGPGVKAGK